MIMVLTVFMAIMAVFMALAHQTFFFGHFVLREEFMKKRKFLQYELISKCTGVVINSKLTKVNTTNK